MRFAVAISEGAEGTEKRLEVEADNWMLALRQSLDQAGCPPMKLGAASCEIQEDSSITINDSRLARTIRISIAGQYPVLASQATREDSQELEESTPVGTMTYLEAQIEQALLLPPEPPVPPRDLEDDSPDVRHLPFIKVTTKDREVLGLERKPRLEAAALDLQDRRRVQYLSVVKVDLPMTSHSPMVTSESQAGPWADPGLAAKMRELELAFGRILRLPPEEAPTLALEVIRRVVGSSQAWVTVALDDGRMMLLAASGDHTRGSSGLVFSFNRAEPAALALLEGIGISLQCSAASSRPVLVDPQDWRCCGGLLCVPVFLGDQPGAVIQLYRRQEEGPFNEQDLILVERAASLCSGVLRTIQVPHRRA
jgi:hypothetical protein